jgi:hypothetical protein
MEGNNAKVIENAEGKLIEHFSLIHVNLG